MINREYLCGARWSHNLTIVLSQSICDFITTRVLINRLIVLIEQPVSAVIFHRWYREDMANGPHR